MTRTPADHIDGTAQGKMVAYAQLATLGLSAGGLYVIAPLIVDGPGSVTGWWRAVAAVGANMQQLPIVGGAAILGVIPYLYATVRNFTDRVPESCELPHPKRGSWFVPVGRTVGGKWLYHDFAGGSPHTLVPGSTGSGKSVFIQFVLYMLCQQQSATNLILDIIDLKQGATFDMWSLVPHVRNVRYDISGALKGLAQARDTMNDRLAEIRRAKRAFQALPEHPHYFVVIDEGSLLSLDDKCLDLLQEISAIGREPRIHIIYATQRPSNRVLPTEIRDQLEARFCFRVNEPGSSEIVLGRDNLAAYEMERRYKGRCIMQTPIGEFTIQTPFLSDKARNAWLQAFTETCHHEVQHKDEVDAMGGFTSIPSTLATTGETGW